jgi:malonyl CoA-acyl carrier protein transacylase
MKVNHNVSSKLLDRKWKERDMDLHKRKLRQIKSSVRQVHTPYIIDAAMRQAKKDAMLERKQY